MENEKILKLQEATMPIHKMCSLGLGQRLKDKAPVLLNVKELNMPIHKMCSLGLKKKYSENS